MVCGDLTFSRCIPIQFSIFSAELVTISRALGHVVICRLLRAIIYTDSLSSLQCLASFSISCHPYFHLTQKLLVRISDLGLTVYFCWVPSHCGILAMRLLMLLQLLLLLMLLQLLLLLQLQLLLAMMLLGIFPFLLLTIVLPSIVPFLFLGRFSGHKRP